MRSHFEIYTFVSIGFNNYSDVKEVSSVCEKKEPYRIIYPEPIGYTDRYGAELRTGDAIMKNTFVGIITTKHEKPIVIWLTGSYSSDINTTKGSRKIGDIINHKDKIMRYMFKSKHGIK